MAKTNTKKKKKVIDLETKKNKKNEGVVISSKAIKAPPDIDTDDHMSKFVLSFFDKELKKEFVSFLQQKAEIIPIEEARDKKKKRTKTKYKQEGEEPISFKEVTSFANPAFSMGSSFSPEEYNPETIDVSTFTLMRRDPQLAAGLAVIKLPIISLPWRIECDDINISKTVEWALNNVWRELVSSSLLAVDYGFACHEKVWERDHVKVSTVDEDGKETVYHDGDLAYYKKIKPNHPESVSMKFDKYQNLIEVIQQSTYSSRKIELPVRKVFIFTNSMEFGNPFGVSRLKNAYKVWYWKELLYQFMMQYYERRGTPPAVATVPPGKSRDSAGNEHNNMDLGLRLASSLISSSVAVIPYQVNKDSSENMWKLEFLKDDARGPMFVEAMSHLDARCLRSIYVPENIATSDGGGGYQGVSVNADLFLMSEKGLIADLENSVNRQVIKPFVDANYPPEKRRPALLKLDPLDWNRKIALKEIFIEMLRNIDTMIQMGVAPKIVPSLKKMAQVLEIPIETWKDHTGMEGIPMEEEEKDGGGNPKKVAGRKKTARKSTSQTEQRKRRGPEDRRANRDRRIDPTKKK